jgi:hypothetical protein
MESHLLKRKIQIDKKKEFLSKKEMVWCRKHRHQCSRDHYDAIPWLRKGMPYAEAKAKRWEQMKEGSRGMNWREERRYWKRFKKLPRIFERPPPPPPPEPKPHRMTINEIADYSEALYAEQRRQQEAERLRFRERWGYDQSQVHLILPGDREEVGDMVPRRLTEQERKERDERIEMGEQEEQDQYQRLQDLFFNLYIHPEEEEEEKEE